jgi:hypothetical protein
MLAEDDSNWLYSSSFPYSLYPRGRDARRRFVKCFPCHDLEDESSREGSHEAKGAPDMRTDENDWFARSCCVINGASSRAFV